MANALRSLHRHLWNDSLPIKSCGSSGRSFQFPFETEKAKYALVFDCHTDRNNQKEPIRHHIYLKTILDAND